MLLLESVEHILTITLSDSVALAPGLTRSSRASDFLNISSPAAGQCSAHMAQRKGFFLLVWVP
jgi:hypothetical protein